MKVHLREIKSEYSKPFNASGKLVLNGNFPMQPGSIREYVFRQGNRVYGIAIQKNEFSWRVFYSLYRPSGRCGWTKIKCSTRAEEKSYPTAAAWMATYLVEMHEKKLADKNHF